MKLHKLLLVRVLLAVVVYLPTLVPAVRPSTLSSATALMTAVATAPYLWQPSHGPTGGSVLGFGLAEDAGVQHAITAITGAFFQATLGASTIWSPMGLSNLPADLVFTGFGASPNFAQDGRLFVSGYTIGTANGNFYASADGGQTWISKVPLACQVVRASPSFAVDHILLAGCASDSALLSTDGGATWNQRDVTAGGDYITDVEFSPGFSIDGTAFAVSSGGGMWRSTNQGMNWSPFSNFFGGAVRQFSLSPSWSVDHLMYVAGYSQFARLDQSSSQSLVLPADAGSPIAIIMAPDFSSSQRVIASTGHATFISADGGAHWGSPLSYVMTDIAWSPTVGSDDTGWMLTDGAGILETHDNGATWNPINNGLLGARVRDLQGVSGSTTMLAAVSGAGVFVSRNSGWDWAWVSSGITNSQLLSVAASPAFNQDGTAFAGSDGSGTFRTTDSGASWHPIGPVSQYSIHVFALDVSPGFSGDHLVLAGTNQGVYRSLNGGDVWTRTEGLSGVDTLALSPNFSVDGVALAGTTNGVMRSTDHGGNWNYSNTGLPTTLPPYGPETTAVAFSPQFAVDRTVYIGTINDGIFRSTDGGASWTPAYSGLLHPNVLALGWLTGTASAPLMLASARLSQSYAVYSSSSPINWSPLAPPFEIWRAVNVLRPSYEGTPALLAGTEGRGLWFYQACSSCALYLPIVARP